MEREESGSAEKDPTERPEFEKERETKDDGRYIVFYTFADEEGEIETSGEEGAG